MKLLQAAALMSLLVLGAGRPSTAQQPAGQPVCVDQLAECVYLVRVSNPAQLAGHLQLVRTTDGAVLYDKSSAAASFGERLNVSHLADGQYAVVVKLGRATHRFALALRTTHTRQAQLLSLAASATR